MKVYSFVKKEDVLMAIFCLGLFLKTIPAMGQEK